MKIGRTNISGMKATLLLACLFYLYSCSLSDLKNRNLPTIGESVALFDFFHYKGEDDFYTENPLPGVSSYYNPILPGWHSDPSICSDGENYFLVTSSFAYYPGVPLFHSKDLINWKQIGNVLNRPSQLDLEGLKVSEGILAPTIEYNPHNKTYYMVTTNTAFGNFFVKTQDPFGEWSDPIMLPGVEGIDPSFFFDEDGSAYILNCGEPEGTPEYPEHRTIKIQAFDVATDKTIGPRKALVNKGVNPEENPLWIAAPHLYKINGKYLLLCTEGGTGSWHSEVVFSSDAPMGKFTAWERNPILTQRHLNPERPNTITSAGHADLIQAKEGDWWMVFLACRPINNTFENLGRETFLMPVKWSNDCFPYVTQGDDMISMIDSRLGVERSENVTFGNFGIKDNFDSETLGLEWITLRGPATNLYSLSETPGYLTLKCTDASVKDRATPAFLCRPVQHHKFECTVRMLFDSSDEKDAAGLLLFKDEHRQYFLSVGTSETGKCVTLKQTNKVLAKQNIDNQAKAIDLKIISKGLYYDFYYATQEGKWESLSKNVDAGYLSTSAAGGFTGTTIGVYAVKH